MNTRFSTLSRCSIKNTLFASLAATWKMHGDVEIYSKMQFLQDGVPESHGQNLVLKINYDLVSLSIHLPLI